PDEIYLGISLKESDSKGRISIEKQEEDLKRALISLGIDVKENLKVNNVNSYYYKKIFKKDTYASKKFQLKVSDAHQLANVFQKLNDLKVSSVNIIKLEYSKKETLLKELRTKAIKKAKDRAIYMLSAIEESIGKPLEIHDNSYYHPITYYNQPRVMAMKMEADAASPPSMPNVDFKKIELRVTVNAKFEIK
ncbi:MAG: SIMPL domain-containing protein, partial [Flavobacteriales bacterium]